MDATRVSGIKLADAQLVHPGRYKHVHLKSVDFKGIERRVWEELPIPLRAIGRARPPINVQDAIDFLQELKEGKTWKKILRLIPGKYFPQFKKSIAELPKQVQYFLKFKKSMDELPQRIEASGIKEKYVVEQTPPQDEDIQSGKKHYDPAGELGALAVGKIISHLRASGIPLKEVGMLYVACSTSYCNDPPIDGYILNRLVRDGIVTQDEVSDWKIDVITKGCIGWVSLVNRLASEMCSPSWGKNKKYAIGCAVGVNSIYLDGVNPHEIIAYGDGGAAALFSLEENGAGKITFDELKRYEIRDSQVAHPVIKTVTGGLTHRIKHSLGLDTNYFASKKTALAIAKHSPGQFAKLVNDSENDIGSFDHIVASQTSKSVIDDIILGLLEIKRNELGISSNIRPEFDHSLEAYRDGFAFREKMRVTNLCENLFSLFEKYKHDKKALEQIQEKLNKDEQKLWSCMIHLDKIVVRSYTHHAYTGVASIPMAIAEFLELGIIDLNKDSIAMLGSGLVDGGINVQGSLVNNDYKIVESKAPEAKSFNSRIIAVPDLILGPGFVAHAMPPAIIESYDTGFAPADITSLLFENPLHNGNGNGNGHGGKLKLIRSRVVGGFRNLRNRIRGWLKPSNGHLVEAKEVAVK